MISNLLAGQTRRKGGKEERGKEERGKEARKGRKEERDVLPEELH